MIRITFFPNTTLAATWSIIFRDSNLNAERPIRRLISTDFKGNSNGL